MSRRDARKHAFSLVFGLGFNKTELDIMEVFDDYIQNTVSEEDKITKKDKEFIYAEFEGTYNNLDEIDKIIRENLVDWSMDRLNKADIAILRVAIYEMKFGDTPAGVAVNEGVELAKDYSSDEGPEFINGILRKVAKGLT